MVDPGDGVPPSSGGIRTRVNGSGPEPPVFSVRVLSTGERTARVLVAGELDLATSPRLDKALAIALSDADEVVLDLSRMTFIDSTGLSAILSAVTASQLDGSTLTINSALAPQARKVFELAGMQEALPLVDE